MFRPCFNSVKKVGNVQFHPFLRHFRVNSSTRPNLIAEEFISTTTILSYDAEAALKFGKIRGQFLRQGIKFGLMDLEIASIALAHDLTLVTNNIKDFRNVPDLRIVDWLES